MIRRLKRYHLLPAATVVALVVQPAAAQQAAPAAQPSAPQAFLLDSAGRVRTGRLIDADFARRVRLQVDGRPADVGAGHILWLGIEAGPDDASAVRPWFYDPGSRAHSADASAAWARVGLRDGQVLIGRLRAGEPETLALEHRLLGPLTLPFERIAEVQIHAGPAAVPVPPPPAVAKGPGGLDTAVLVNGDRVEGILRAIDPRRTTLEGVDGQALQVPTESVHVLRLAEMPQAMSAPASQPAAGPAWLVLATGERLLREEVVLSGITGTATIISNSRLPTVPLAEVVGVEPTSPRRQWLSSLAPSAYEHHPLLAPRMAWQADATVAGDPIRVDGRLVPRGIGVPAGSRLRYDLAGRYRRLLVRPVLDDSAGRIGTCHAAIRVDGQPAWTGAVSRSTDTGPGGAALLSIDLTGRRELELEVLPGDGADVLDRFVWAWAALIR